MKSQEKSATTTNFSQQITHMLLTIFISFGVVSSISFLQLNVNFYCHGVSHECYLRERRKTKFNFPWICCVYNVADTILKQTYSIHSIYGKWKEMRQ